LDHAANFFRQEHLLDTYVFCLSEHDPTNPDGILSMWRGYGGNGSGAAIVFDTSKLAAMEDSPLIVGKVSYASEQERFAWFAKTAGKAADLLRSHSIPNDKLWLAAWRLFDRIKLFALFTKHHGFAEESEWRVVYMIERDTEVGTDAPLPKRTARRGAEVALQSRSARGRDRS
jgi:hypothetical protein